MKTTYLFYDLETTGLQPCFDQIVQFAAIRTDTSLNEISRHELIIRLNEDVQPDPIAMQTHGLPSAVIAAGQPEIEAIQEIHHLVNTPGTTSVGYNTLRFDDVLLRFSFYRNLLPPYTHQFAQGCSRMDIYPIALLYYLFAPDVLSWPSVDGRASFKLEHINAANQLIEGQSHRAMTDVEITLALSKRLYQRTRIWNYACGYFSKETEQHRLKQLSFAFDDIRLGLLLDGRIGVKHNFLTPAILMGQHAVYRNQMSWLRLDDERLACTDENTIAHSTVAIRKKMGEPPLILPYATRYLEKLDSHRRDTTETHLQWLKNNTSLYQQICHHHQHDVYPPVDSIDADAALYQIPFPTPQEEMLFRDFHQATPQEKQKIMERFPNPIRKEQALRILGRHYPEVLTPHNKMLYQQYLKRLKEEGAIDYKGERHNRRVN